MKKNLINETHIEGILYEHSLDKKVTGPNSKHPNTEYISGSINIATDPEMTNTISVFYTYVTPTTSKGSVNSTYTTLENIIDGKYKAYVDCKGEETPVKFRIDSRIGLREWYKDGDLISTKRNDGGFIHVVTQLNENVDKRATFKTDMVITSVKRIEADEEKDTPERVVIKGAIFDSYRKSLLPVEYTVLNPAAMDYFEGLEASSRNPVFTNVWGKQVSKVVTKRTVTDSAFGDPDIKETSTTRKDFVITGAMKEPYVWDDDSTLLATELQTMMQERDTYLATLKQQAIEYQNSAKAKPASAPSVKNSDYDF